MQTPVEIPKAVFEEWLALLRSGQIEQCRGTTHRLEWPSLTTSYCPSALLIEVMRKHERDGVSMGEGHEHCMFLFRDLMHWNDRLKLGFTEIADRVESRYTWSDITE